MSASRDLILLIGSLAEATTPEALDDRAGSEFAAKFGSAALDNGLRAEEWAGIEKAYKGGYQHGYAAAIADLTLGAVVGRAVEGGA